MERHQPSFWTRLLDLIAPRACVACQCRLAESEQFVCTICLLRMPRTDFALHSTDNLMARMLWGRADIERAAALFRYQPTSPVSKAIQEMKYKNQPELGRFLGRFAAEELASTYFFEDIDALLPMPITRKRQRERGYNQSQLIAEGISAVTGIPILNKVVKRTHFVQSQTRQNMLERQLNVEGAFQLVDGEALRDKHILLIDDVMTTGATMGACCQQLQQAPGVRISVFALAFTQY